MKKYKDSDLVKNVIMTTKQVQSFDQSICGWYCLNFLHHYITQDEEAYIAIHSINSVNTTNYGKILTEKLLNNKKILSDQHIKGGNIIPDLYNYYIDPRQSSDTFLLKTYNLKKAQLDEMKVDNIEDYRFRGNAAHRDITDKIHTIAKACYTRGLINYNDFLQIENTITTDLNNLD